MAKAKTELSLEEVVSLLEGLPKDSKGKPLTPTGGDNRDFRKAVEYLPAMQAALTELKQLRAAAPVTMEPDATIAPYTLEPGMFNAMVAMSVAQEAALAEREAAVGEREAAVEAREREAAAREDVAEAREAKAIEKEKRLEEKQIMFEAMVKAARESELPQQLVPVSPPQEETSDQSVVAEESPSLPAPVAQEEVDVVAPKFEKPDDFYGEISTLGWSCTIKDGHKKWTYKLAQRSKANKVYWIRTRWTGDKTEIEYLNGFTANNPPKAVLDYILAGGKGNPRKPGKPRKN